MTDAGQDRQRIWGRGGDRPNAGKLSGKNAAEDRRPAPLRRYSRGVKRRAVRTEEDLDLVSRGTKQEVEDEQEDLRIYESEVDGVLFWRRLGRRFGRFGQVMTPRRLVETSLWGF